MTGSKNASLLADVPGRSLAYLEGAQSRRVSPGKAEVQRLSELGGPLPDAPSAHIADSALIRRGAKC